MWRFCYVFSNIVLILKKIDLVKILCMEDNGDCLNLNFFIYYFKKYKSNKEGK